MKNRELSKKLLQIKAVKLSTDNLFTWASGIKSPIYCDNRITLSFPTIRTFIKHLFVDYIKKNYADVEVIAGVATGAIAIGALVAEEMNLPFIYVRSDAKKHGRQNKIEGYLMKNSKVVVIEDLISTGGSSLSAIETLRNAETNVLGLIAIFSYGFDIATKKFADANCKFATLTNYSSMIEVAINEKYIEQKHIKILEEWQKEYSNS